MIRTNRITAALDFYNNQVASHKNEVAEGNSIWDIRKEALQETFEAIFNGNPNKEESRWINKELQAVEAYTNTENW